MENTTSSYRILQIAGSTEFFDAASRCDDWGLLADVMNVLVGAARYDEKIKSAMRDIAQQYVDAEEAMVDHYTSADRFADLDAQHYATAA